MPLSKIHRTTDKAAEAVEGLELEPWGGSQGLIKLDGTVEAIQSFVDEVTASKWYHLYTPPRTPRRIEIRASDNLRPGWAAFCYFNPPKRPVITIHNDFLEDPWVILHEIAHVMTWRAEGAGHTRLFTKNLFLLVRDWFDPSYAWILKRYIIKDGIKINPKELFVPDST